MTFTTPYTEAIPNLISGPLQSKMRDWMQEAEEKINWSMPMLPSSEAAQEYSFHTVSPGVVDMFLGYTAFNPEGLAIARWSAASRAVKFQALSDDDAEAAPILDLHRFGDLGPSAKIGLMRWVAPDSAEANVPYIGIQGVIVNNDVGDHDGQGRLTAYGDGEDVEVFSWAATSISMFAPVTIEGSVSVTQSSGGGASLKVVRVDAGATGVIADWSHQSASEAAADDIVLNRHLAFNSADEETVYTQTRTAIVSTTATAESGVFCIDTRILGTLATRWSVGSGLAASGYTDPGAGGIAATTFELGHNNDTTLARLGAARVGIEGVEIATASNTLTMSNKTFSGATTFTGAVSINGNGSTAADASADNLVMRQEDGSAGMSLISSTSGNSVIDFGDTSNTQVGRILYGHADDRFLFYTDGTLRWNLDGGHLLFGADNTQNVGGPSNRAAVIYAGTGTINTSDAREKTDLQPIEAALRRAVITVFKGVGIFQWKDAVEAKGDAARLHAGVTAQAVEKAFADEGLDASRYALFCADPLVDYVEERGEPTVEYREVTRMVRTKGGKEPRVQRRKFEVYTNQRLVAKPRLDKDGKQIVRKGLRYDQLYALGLGVITEQLAA